VSEAREALLRILKAEEALYLRMRDLLQREWDLMVELDAAALEETARTKFELADEGRLLEESRQAATEVLAAELGLDSKRPTLPELCERLGPDAEALRETHTVLLILVSVVRELLEANEALAGSSVAQIRGTLRLLGSLAPSDGLYDSRTSAEPPPLAAGRLLRQSA